MSPFRVAATLGEHYDQGLLVSSHQHLPVGYVLPQPSSVWCKENIALYEQYRDWLLDGGASEMAAKTIYLPIAGHVLGLNLKPYREMDLEDDLERAMEYVLAKKLSADWQKACRNGLNKFLRFLRLERGLAELSQLTPFDAKRATVGLPAWLILELENYQRRMQRNWRDARFEQNIRRFWSGYLRIWRFLVEECSVQKLEDLKRKHILDYVDLRLQAKYSVSGVNNDLRNMHTFLLFLQEQEYVVPQSLLRIPPLKQPDPLPRYLTDKQVKKLRDEIERSVQEAKLASHRRLSLLVRSAFYLLWQGGMRLGEVEELRLEDLDLPQKRLAVRDGKGRKDRRVYLTDSILQALREYLAVRGAGSGEHVFLYRNAPLKKDLIRCALRRAGEAAGVKTYPHRLRHTCATQLLNAGCKITSIQIFLGHKDLASTLIYARAHDQTVADDYFAAMQRVEQRLEILPKLEQEDEVVKVQPDLFQLIEQLEMPKLCLEERRNIALQLRELFGAVHQHAPPLQFSAG
jgi:site-specific recombinase XerD